MLRYIVGAGAAVVLLSSTPVEAQQRQRLSLQVGIGFEVPRGEFADLADRGSGWSLGAGMQLIDFVAVYAGYSRIRFDAPELNGDLIDSGFSAGISLVLPDLGVGLQPWAGGGVVLNRLERVGAPEQPGRGDPGLGLGGGILLPPVGAVRISPSIGYVRYRSSFPGRDDLTVSYLSVGIALNFTQ